MLANCRVTKRTHLMIMILMFCLTLGATANNGRGLRDGSYSQNDGTDAGLGGFDLSDSSNMMMGNGAIKNLNRDDSSFRMNDDFSNKDGNLRKQPSRDNGFNFDGSGNQYNDGGVNFNNKMSFPQGKFPAADNDDRNQVTDRSNKSNFKNNDQTLGRPSANQPNNDNSNQNGPDFNANSNKANAKYLKNNNIPNNNNANNGNGPKNYQNNQKPTDNNNEKNDQSKSQKDQKNSKSSEQNSKQKNSKNSQKSSVKSKNKKQKSSNKKEKDGHKKDEKSSQRSDSSKKDDKHKKKKESKSQKDSKRSDDSRSRSKSRSSESRSEKSKKKHHKKHDQSQSSSRRSEKSKSKTSEKSEKSKDKSSVSNKTTTKVAIGAAVGTAVGAAAVGAGIAALMQLKKSKVEYNSVQLMNLKNDTVVDRNGNFPYQQGRHWNQYVVLPPANAAETDEQKGARLLLIHLKRENKLKRAVDRMQEAKSLERRHRNTKNKYRSKHHHHNEAKNTQYINPSLGNYPKEQFTSVVTQVNQDMRRKRQLILQEEEQFNRRRRGL